MKYKVYLTINGFIEVDAEDESEAREIAEAGYSITDVVVESDEIDDVELEP